MPDPQGFVKGKDTRAYPAHPYRNSILQMGVCGCREPYALIPHTDRPASRASAEQTPRLDATCPLPLTSGDDKGEPHDRIVNNHHQEKKTRQEERQWMHTLCEPYRRRRRGHWALEPTWRPADACRPPSRDRPQQVAVPLPGAPARWCHATWAGGQKRRCKPPEWSGLRQGQERDDWEMLTAEAKKCVENSYPSRL